MLKDLKRAIEDAHRHHQDEGSPIVGYVLVTFDACGHLVLAEVSDAADEETVTDLNHLVSICQGLSDGVPDDDDEIGVCEGTA